MGVIPILIGQWRGSKPHTGRWLVLTSVLTTARAGSLLRVMDSDCDAAVAKLRTRQQHKRKHMARWTVGLQKLVFWCDKTCVGTLVCHWRWIWESHCDLTDKLTDSNWHRTALVPRGFGSYFLHPYHSNILYLHFHLPCFDLIQGFYVLAVRELGAIWEIKTIISPSQLLCFCEAQRVKNVIGHNCYFNFPLLMYVIFTSISW